MATKRGLSALLRHIPLVGPNRLKKKKSQVALIPPPDNYPVDHIPSEVWQEIFRYLALSAHDLSFRYGIIPSTWDLTTIVEAFHSLYATTLVCRHWYPLGNQVLYSTPALISNHGVECFRRTLNEAPGRISPLVKEIFIVDVVSRKTAVHPFSFSQRKQLAKRFKEDVLAIIPSFPGLQKAFISIQHEFTLPTQWLLAQESPLCHHLRKLTLHQTTFHAMSYELSFNQLQVLCLHVPS